MRIGGVKTTCSSNPYCFCNNLFYCCNNCCFSCSFCCFNAFCCCFRCCNSYCFVLTQFIL